MNITFDVFLPRAAWGVGIAYLLLGGILSADVILREDSIYLLPGMWGGLGIFLSPFSAIVLFLARNRPLSRTETIMAQLPLLGFGLTAALMFFVVGVYGIHTD
ncbi:hypothetical protein KBA41_11525 [Candidatus Ozemobacteraceae bacterium]|nr:hypothetical protein [Candidatus Ozemobacteraceae bacterium]